MIVVSPGDAYHLIKFWINSVWGILGDFFFNSSDVFFNVKYTIGHILSWLDMKQKANALVGYWITYVTLTFDFIFDFDLGVFNVNFEKVVSQHLSV